jgi:hypothetical protein
MEWKNRQPLPDETGLSIGEGQAPDGTHETDALREAAASFCETYDTLGLYGLEFELTCEKYVDGVPVAGFRVTVRPLDPNEGLESTD